MKTLEKFFTNKVWSVKEFWIIAGVLGLNPVVIATIDFIFGFQFLVGLAVGMIAIVAFKTDWKEKE